MLLKNLIRNIPKNKKIFLFLELPQIVKRLKKIIFFLQLKEIKLMVKNLLKTLLKKGHL